MLYNGFLKEYANSLNIDLSERQTDLLLQYKDLVLEANKRFNLTAIVDDNEFIIKHIIDSLAGVSEIDAGAKVLDIGAGAGFPSVPIAIAREDTKVCALDSTAKKMNFVSESAKRLDIKNIATVSGRAEDQKSMFSSFDVVTARAVSSLPILLELSIPFLVIGGKFIAYKTDESELSVSKNALSVLGAKHVNTKLVTLPNGDSRAILVFEKTKPTPSQYPRQYGTIKKKPL